MTRQWNTLEMCSMAASKPQVCTHMTLPFGPSLCVAYKGTKYCTKNHSNAMSNQSLYKPPSTKRDLHVLRLDHVSTLLAKSNTAPMVQVWNTLSDNGSVSYHTTGDNISWNATGHCVRYIVYIIKVLNKNRQWYIGITQISFQGIHSR